MVIRGKNGVQVNVKAVHTDVIKGINNYPAFRFEFENEVTADQVEALIGGSFDILDDNGNATSTYEGYTTLHDIVVIVGKITEADKKVEELEVALADEQTKNATLESNLTETQTALADEQAKNDILQNSLDVAEAANVELQDALNIVVGGNAE